MTSYPREPLARNYPGLATKLPRNYPENTYAQFDQLLQAYPEVHPEDFVTFGNLQELPRRGLYREWGKVAGVLSHMIGGRQSLVTELINILNRIQRLDHNDPMRVTEEHALVAVLLRERRRSAVPLGDEAFPQLAAPGGPLYRPPQPGPSGAPRDPRRHPPPPSPSDSTPGPSGAQAAQLYFSLGPQGPRGDVQQGLYLGLRAQGGPRRPPPGFPDLVDLTTDADEEEMDDAPATPSPNVSDDGSGEDSMETDEEEDLLAYTGEGRDGADGFEHV